MDDRVSFTTPQFGGGFSGMGSEEFDSVSVFLTNIANVASSDTILFCLATRWMPSDWCAWTFKLNLVHLWHILVSDINVCLGAGHLLAHTLDVEHVVEVDCYVSHLIEII